LLPVAYADDSAYPAILLEEYRVEGNLAPGDDIVLEYTLRNTSSSASISNVVVTVSDSRGYFYPAQGTSNQDHIPAIPIRGTSDGSFKLTVNRDAPEGTHNLNFTMQYQGSGSATAMLEIDCSISLEIRGDLLEAVGVSLPGQCVEGEPVFLSVSYKNNGRQELTGVRVLVEGNIEEAGREIAVGSVRPGLSGIAEGTVVFRSAGEQGLSVSLAYETADGRLVTSKPASAECIVLAPSPSGEEWPADPAPAFRLGGLSGELSFALTSGAAAVCTIALAVLLLRRRRRR
jgi:hypothetical protein